MFDAWQAQQRAQKDQERKAKTQAAAALQGYSSARKMPSEIMTTVFTQSTNPGAIFELIDKEWSGSLSEMEMTTALAEFGLAPEVAEQVMKALDTNSDGIVDEGEFKRGFEIFKGAINAATTVADYPPEMQPRIDAVSSRCPDAGKPAVVAAVLAHGGHIWKAIDSLRIEANAASARSSVGLALTTTDAELAAAQINQVKEFRAERLRLVARCKTEGSAAMGPLAPVARRKSREPYTWGAGGDSDHKGHGHVVRSSLAGIHVWAKDGTLAPLNATQFTLSRTGEFDSDMGNCYNSTNHTLSFRGETIWTFSTESGSNIGGSWGADSSCRIDEEDLVVKVEHRGRVVGGGHDTTEERRYLLQEILVRAAC